MQHPHETPLRKHAYETPPQNHPLLHRYEAPVLHTPGCTRAPISPPAYLSRSPMRRIPISVCMPMIRVSASIPSWRKPLPHPDPCPYAYLCPHRALRVGIFATVCPTLDIGSACSLSELASAYGFADVVRVSRNFFRVPTLPKPLRNPNHNRNPRAHG